MTGAAIPPGVVADAAAAAGAWLRAADGNDGAAVARLSAAAIELAEAFCARVFVARGFEEMPAVTGGWTPLAAAPVSAIDAVVARAADGTETALATGSYAVDIDGAGTGWVRVTAPPAQATRLVVRYRAGDAAAWDALPPAVAQGIAMLVAHLFDRRDGDEAPPSAVAALWRPWRRIAIGRERRA